MYTFNVTEQGENEPFLTRCMSANKPTDLLPVLIVLCSVEFHWSNPVALSMGHGEYRLFDLDHPNEYAKVTIMQGGN